MSRKILRKLNVMMIAIILVTIVSGTAVYASRVTYTNKDSKVGLHTTEVAIPQQMVVVEANQNLGENPQFQGSLQVQVSGAPSDATSAYKLHTSVKVYADKACTKEIQQGFKAKTIDTAKALHGNHDIRVILTMEDSTLGGQQIFVKAFSSIEKV